MNIDDLIDLEEDVLVDVADPEPTPDPEPAPDPEPEPDPEPSPDPEPDEEALLYYQYLLDNGVLEVPEDFQFDGTADGISKALEITRNSQLARAQQEIWDRLPEDFRPLLIYGLQGGTSLESYLNAYSPKDISSLDLEDTLSQKLVLKEYYKLTNPNFNEERIDRMISKLEATADLKDEAEDALDYIQQLQQERKDQFLQQQEEARRQQEAELQQYVTSIKDAIKASELNDVEKGAVEAMLFNPNRQTSEFDEKINSAYKNPKHFVQLVDIFRDYHPETGFTFEKLKKRLKSDSNKSFAQVLRKQDNKTQVQGSSRNIHEDFDFSQFTGN